MCVYLYNSPKIYNDHPVRIVQRDGEPWFVAKDVCHILKLANPRSSIALLDSDEKGVHTVDTPFGEQEMTVVSEAGLYCLILRSRKPEAKAFKRWVTHEVLPSIRKTGAYVAPNLNLEQIAAVAKKIGEMAKHLIEKNAMLYEKIAFLEQFCPNGDMGDISSINGKPKCRQRRGAYVSGKGKKPKRLDPDKGGYLQMDLFRDFIPEMLITEAVNIININIPNLLENKNV